MNEIEQSYLKWKEKTVDIPYLYEELLSLQNCRKQVTERFYKNLSFGTGGLRGLLGVGTNRMNMFTVGKVTQGLANYLLKKTPSPSIAIAYDTRNFSKEFANHVANVCCANDINVYLFDDARPTPMLSFAVKHLKADAGIVITASHNPKEYNGYKVYGNDGSQITDGMASSILYEIDACEIFSDVKSTPWEKTKTSEKFHYISSSTDDEYYEKIKALSLRKDLLKKSAKKLNILYTPLHGTGNLPVRRILKELGFSSVSVVKEQEKADGNFPTIPSPNPEDAAVYELAIKQAVELNPDLIFATDPDADRIGVLVKNENQEFSVLTGNQVGVLLTDYIINAYHEEGTMPKNPAVIKTIVTSDMGKEICKEKSVAMIETLTGFKYIGELVEEWHKNNAHSFLFGFEESYGYLAGDFVRDKDAIIAAALIAEMTLYYVINNITLFQALENLYKKYGYYTEKLISISMPGEEGQKKIASILSSLRKNYPEVFSFESLAVLEDYSKQETLNVVNNTKQRLLFPKSDVLKFIFDDKSWVVFRPSGTEPKMKVYLSAIGKTRIQSHKRLEELRELVNNIIK